MFFRFLLYLIIFFLPLLAYGDDNLPQISTGFPIISTQQATLNVIAPNGTVTGTVGNSNISCVNNSGQCSATIATNTNVNLTATGSNFSSWSGCPSSNGSICVFDITQNTSVTANFTVSSNNSSNNLPVITSHELGLDLIYRLNAVSVTVMFQNAGYFDLERSTDQINYTRIYCTDSGSMGIGKGDEQIQPGVTYWYRVRMSTQPVSCFSNANWSAFSVPYQVIVPSEIVKLMIAYPQNGKVTGTVENQSVNCGNSNGECQINATINSPVNLIANADDGYSFNGWIGCPVPSTNSNCMFDLTQRTEVDVNFAPIPQSNKPPIASFTLNSTTGTTPLTVSVTQNSSSDPDGSIAKYEWKTSDNQTSTAITPSFTFASAGEYNITLTVTDDKGAITNSAAQKVTVSATPFITVTPTFEERITADYYHTCSLKTDKSAVCWGENDYGQGNIPPEITFNQISTSSSFSCGLKTDGSVICWGGGYGGTPPTDKFTQISIGNGHSGHACGLKTDGGILCWGYNSQGQSSQPSGVFTQVSAGYFDTCGLKTDGSVLCWGANNHGQGRPPVGTFSQISVGWSHSCGVKTDGSILCWGNNYSGQSNSPSGTFIQVSTGGAYTCGLKTDHTVICWGYALDSINGVTNSPPDKFVQIVSGYYHACGLKAEGSVVCWGAGKTNEDKGTDNGTEYGQSIVPSELSSDTSIDNASDVSLQIMPSDNGIVSGVIGSGMLYCGNGDNVLGSHCTVNFPTNPIPFSPVIQAVPKAGYSFVAWSDPSICPNATADLCNPVLSGGKTLSLSATFKLNGEPTIDPNVTVGGNVTTTPTISNVRLSSSIFEPGKQVEISWNSTGQTKYVIYLYDDSSNSLMSDAACPSNSFHPTLGSACLLYETSSNSSIKWTVPWVLPAGHYTFKVAVGNGNNWSDVVVATSPQEALIYLEIIPPTNGIISGYIGSSTIYCGNGDNNVIGDKCSAQGFSANIMRILTATPKQGFVFSEWSDASVCLFVTDTSCLPTTTGSNAKLTANFTATETPKPIVRIVAAKVPDKITFGENFDVTLQFIPDTMQPADGIQIYLEFDPSKLRVNKVTNSGVLDFELQNEIGGNYIDFAASVFGNSPPLTPFDLVTINFTALESTGEIGTLLHFDSTKSQVAHLGEYIPQEYSDIKFVIEDILQCKVNLQGRNSVPSSSWETELKLYFNGTFYTVNTDDSGYCVLPQSIPLGDHSICVKNSHTLASRVGPPLVANSDNVVDFGLLLEGDVDDDNKIGVSDMSEFHKLTDFSKNYHEQADLNADGQVNMTDANLLKSNFGRPKLGETGFCQWNETEKTYRRGTRDGKDSNAVLTTSLIPTGLMVNDSFAVDILVQMDDIQAVDASAVYLNFNPSALQANRLISKSNLDFELLNEIDNSKGEINYAASIWNNHPIVGTFTLVTIEFTVLTLGGEQTLSFSMVSPRNSDTVSMGESVLNMKSVGVNFSEMQGTAECLLYGVQDQGVNDSIFFTVDPLNGNVKQIGDICEGCDIEATAIDPFTNEMYLGSGDNAIEYPKGHLYKLNPITGTLRSVGDTGFTDISGLSFDDNGVLWGWAKGQGLVILNIRSGQGELVLPSLAELSDLTWDSNYQNLYGVIGKELWSYTPATGETPIKLCDNLPYKTEAIKVLPLSILPEGLILLGTHSNKKLELRIFDMITCQLHKESNFIVGYDDVEGLTMPVAACK